MHLIRRILILLLCLQTLAFAQDDLARDFLNPPDSAKVRAYWWWLNGNVTRASITHDLEEMKAKGFGGALICDADGAAQDGNQRVPHGPTFFSAEWRDLYKHALREANRLGLEMSLNIQSGWNLGGPVVPAEDAPKSLTWSETRVTGPVTFSGKPALPPIRENFYRDLVVLAVPARPAKGGKRPPIKNLSIKALIKGIRPFSAPDTTPLFEELESKEGEEDAHTGQVLDLTPGLKADGKLEWKVPAGDWDILRFGFTLNEHCRVSTSSEGWGGYALDPFDRGAFQRYWAAVVEPLIEDAGPLAGTTLKYVHTDSWEVEVANWTPTLRQEFKTLRGYDLLPWLPVIAGKIIDDRGASNRFLHDLRRTMGDLAIDNHFRIMRDNAHRHGILIHPESGGPHAVPIDAQQCLGFTDAPMSEFWASSWKHRVRDQDRFFVKQPASAAHTYGHNLVLAEGFTTIGPHWQETLGDNLKPAFDRACCEGLNRLVWHAFVCSPKEMGVPGQQYFAGTHLNPNVTWWKKSAAFFTYLNRCQFMLQRGMFVADVCYCYGNHVPNFAQLKASDPARVLPGHDYDVLSEEVLLTRLSAKDGRLVLPDGMSYQVLALPKFPLSNAAAKKIEELKQAGAVVAGPDQPAAAGIPPDFECKTANLGWIHRRDGATDIYFVANPTKEWTTADCSFRVTGKNPELWDPVTGKIHGAKFTVSGDHTRVSFEMPPYGSMFVVFGGPGAQAPLPAPKPVQDIAGPWTVHFDPKWGGPLKVTFNTLVDWSTRSEPGIKYYSGTATYRTTFAAKVQTTLGADPADQRGARVFIDLGAVRELASVRLNGKDLGVVWTMPFRVEVTGLLKPADNVLEIDVTNFWPNRIIGDQFLPKEKRLTRTNISTFSTKSALMPSGLLGPVQLMAEPKAEP